MRPTLCRQPIFLDYNVCSRGGGDGRTGRDHQAHQSALRCYAQTVLCDAKVSDDLIQDTLERAVSGWHQCPSDVNPKTWIFPILHNLAVNHLLSVGASRMGTEDGLGHADNLAAVEQLPDDHRSILLLVSVEAVSYADAARILGIPIGTVMSHLAKCRLKIARK